MTHEEHQIQRLRLRQNHLTWMLCVSLVVGGTCLWLLGRSVMVLDATNDRIIERVNDLQTLVLRQATRPSPWQKHD